MGGGLGATSLGCQKLRNSQVKYSIVLLVILFLNCTKTNDVKNNAISCDNFHNGKFQIINYDSTITEIERIDSTQIERTIHGTNKYRIIWSSDCEYTLVPLELNIELSKKLNIKKYYFKIIDIDSNKCTFESRVDEHNGVYKGEMKKVD